MKRYSILFMMVFVGLQSAYAGGYQVPEMGAKAMAMGNAFTAVADDASALWYNPAGLAFAKTGQVMLGGTLLAPNTRYTSNAGVQTKAKNNLALAPYAYISNIQENTGIAWGLGMNAPFGTKVDWPTTAPFATNAVFGTLEMIIFNPNIAFKISDHFALAVGVDYGWLKQVQFNSTVFPQDFHGDGWGYNVGLLYKNDQFNLGLTYRSQIKVNAKGSSKFLPTASSSPNTVNVTLPDMLSVGVAFFPADNITLSVNVDWVNWKKFKELKFNYSSPIVLPTGLAPPFPPVVAKTTITSPQNWKATTAFRVGFEWVYTPATRFRLGYAYEPSAVKNADFTPLLPTNDLQTFSTGIGYDLGDNVTVDVAYMYVLFKDRQQTLSTGAKASRNGLYKVDLHLFGGSMTYRF